MNLRVSVVWPELPVCKRISPARVWIEHRDDVEAPRLALEHRRVPRRSGRRGRIGSVFVFCKHIE